MAVWSAFRKTRWYKLSLWSSGLFLAYVLIGFFLLPAIIRWQMLKRLPEITQRTATVRQVKVNPLALSLTIRGLELAEPDGRPLASWEELYINFQSSSLFRWAWTFDEIRLVKPFGEIILLKDGRLNIANIFEPAPGAAPKPDDADVGQPASVPSIQIFSMRITNGFLAMEDRTRRSVFRTEYRPINLHLHQFTTRPNSDTPYSFHAESDAGRSVTWAGDLSVQPLASSGKLEVTGVQLQRYQPYLEDFTRAILTNGLADVHLEYSFSAGTNGMDLSVTNGVLTAGNLRILDPDTGETVFSLNGAAVERAGLDFRTRQVHIGAVRVSEATVLARLKPGGQLNLLDLVSVPDAGPAGTNAPATTPGTGTNAAPNAPAAPWTIALGELVVEKASVTAEDLTRRTAFKTLLQPIELRVEQFSTVTNRDARYNFRLATESSETLEGNGTFCINPVRSAGHVQLTTFDVKKYLPYAEQFLRGKLTAGKLNLEIPYDFALEGSGLHAGVSNAAVHITGLEMESPDGTETPVRLGKVSLERVEARLEDRLARVGLLRAENGNILVRRDKQGGINLLNLLVESPGDTATNTAAATVAPPVANATSATAPAVWAASLDEIVVDGYTIAVEDQQPAKSVAMVVDRLALDVKGVSTDPTRPLEVAVSFRLNDTGVVSTRGKVQLDPVSADLQLEADGMDLRAAQPYVEQFVGLGIVSGAARTRGQIKYRADDTAVPQISFQGEVGVTNFLCTDQVYFKEFVSWNDLAIGDVVCELFPNRVKVGSIHWVAPKASVLIGPDRRPNLSLILKQPDTAETKLKAVEATEQGVATEAHRTGGSGSGSTMPVQVDTIKLEHASFALVDQSIQPTASVGIQELNGTIKGLSSELNTTADVDFAGKVDQSSTFAVTGKVNPLSTNLFVDLTISNANTQLTPLTPYMEKYAGYPLHKGRLSTSLRYQIADNELKAENKIQIDQLTLGARNASPDATSVPVKLGIALLKDSNGRIELDVPVSGRLDDPQFSLGPIVLKVVMNMLVKAAASPFKLLGALVGGGEELSFVTFAPGTTNLLESEVEKLGKLAKALQQRPALNLDIEGAVDPLADRQAIARAKVLEDIKTRRLQELKAEGKAPQVAEGFQVEPEEFARLVRLAFVQVYGTNIAAVLQEHQALLVPTNAPASAMPVKTSFWAKARDRGARVVGSFGVGKYAAQSKAEKTLPKTDRLALLQATPEVMQILLAEKMEPTADEYRVLMEARTRFVQEWLTQNGGVGADRLLLIAPKPVDPTYRGESRVNLLVN